MNGRGVKVRPARPGVKPSNRQLKTSVGDKVSMFADRGSAAGIEARWARCGDSFSCTFVVERSSAALCPY